MTTLVIIQTIFYILASVAMISIGVLLAIAIYYLICILKNTKDISEDITHAYKRTKKGIENIINKVKGKNKYHEKHKQEK